MRRQALRRAGDVDGDPVLSVEGPQGGLEGHPLDAVVEELDLPGDDRLAPGGRSRLGEVAPSGELEEQGQPQSSEAFGAGREGEGGPREPGLGFDLGPQPREPFGDVALGLLEEPVLEEVGRALRQRPVGILRAIRRRWNRSRPGGRHGSARPGAGHGPDPAAAGRRRLSTPLRCSREWDLRFKTAPGSSRSPVRRRAASARTASASTPARAWRSRRREVSAPASLPIVVEADQALAGVVEGVEPVCRARARERSISARGPGPASEPARATGPARGRTRPPGLRPRPPLRRRASPPSASGRRW